MSCKLRGTPAHAIYAALCVHSTVTPNQPPMHKPTHAGDGAGPRPHARYARPGYTEPAGRRECELGTADRCVKKACGRLFIYAYPPAFYGDFRQERIHMNQRNLRHGIHARLVGPC
jgi:hypothetical protein